VATKIVKKTRGLSGGAFSSSSSRGRERSPQRPVHVEKLAPCRRTCPSGNRIREFVTAIAQAERLGKSIDTALQQAWEIYTDTSPFPAICGCTCPAPCELQCNRKGVDGPVEINKIERVIGDFGIKKDLKLKALSTEKKPQRVAVVGAGPRGLSCAYQLARRGYTVTVVDTLKSPGALLPWEYSPYRLPAFVREAEIRKVFDLGVEFKGGMKLAKEDIEKLRGSYHAVLEAQDAPQGTRLSLEGENAPNVFNAVDLRNRLHEGAKLDLGKDIVIVGGGDSALGAARTCKRLGADVTLLFRRSIDEMPAVAREVKEAIAEGIRLEALVAPVALVRSGERVTSVRCTRFKLGEPDATGRRTATVLAGSEFELPASAVVSAPATTLITTAVGQGRQAAEAIDAKFLGKTIDKLEMPVIKTDRMRLDHYEKRAPGAAAAASTGEDAVLSPEQAVAESRWCMSCGYCFDCEKCWLFCQDQAIVKPMTKGLLYSFKLENCTGCKKCAEECPCGFIDMM
jgi:NADPH-dependent glutamate synthase beta subunit-like oxidoreductase/Pyruvate/2-oxoacid:ferredoxin oxidoreductase delta subunit